MNTDNIATRRISLGEPRDGDTKISPPPVFALDTFDGALPEPPDISGRELRKPRENFKRPDAPLKTNNVLARFRAVINELLHPDRSPHKAREAFIALKQNVLAAVKKGADIDAAYELIGTFAFTYSGCIADAKTVHGTSYPGMLINGGTWFAYLAEIREPDGSVRYAIDISSAAEKPEWQAEKGAVQKNEERIFEMGDGDAVVLKNQW